MNSDLIYRLKAFFSKNQLYNVMKQTHNIRNICFVGQSNHGKSELVDCLIDSGKFNMKRMSIGNNDMSRNQNTKMEAPTTSSTPISLHFKDIPEYITPRDLEGNGFIVNLVDTPGHPDFSADVTAALRITDGCLIVVDCVGGICASTENIIRQVLQERIKPMLCIINKLDHAFIELQMDHEDMYQNILSIIETINVNISTYHDDILGNVKCIPHKGSVIFSTGIQGWAFTLNTFAQMYSKKFRIKPNKLVERLWGNHYFDKESKKWVKTPKSKSGKPLKRAFCQFILEPIQKVISAALSNKRRVLDKLLAGLGISISDQDCMLVGRNFLTLIMKKWLPASKVLLESIIQNIPSPITAQKYRVENLYTGSLDDETAVAIKNCDPTGPLCMYISKMVQSTQKKRKFFAYGRVFSGTIVGDGSQKVMIYGENYQQEERRNKKEREDFFTSEIKGAVLMLGRNISTKVKAVPCGNLVGLVGIDQFLSKTGTIVENDDTCPLYNMKYSVSPIIRVAVEPKVATDLPKLIQGLKSLHKSDLMIQYTALDTGEHQISGTGELHLEINLKNLINDFMDGEKILVSDPYFSFYETVTSKSSKICLSKSPNKHNRLYATAEPLHSNIFLNNIEKKKIIASAAMDESIKVMEYCSAVDSGKIWSFGPSVFVDSTVGVQYLSEIKDSLAQSFRWVTQESILCEEEMRGVRFDLRDFNIMADAIHRAAGQIIPTARRVLFASFLTAEPKLLHPMYLIEIETPLTVVEDVYSVLTKYHAPIIQQTQRTGTPFISIKTHLPVYESKGFNEELLSNTSGLAFQQSVLDHWRIDESSPLEDGSKAQELVTNLRIRKGLRPQILPLSHFLDTL